MRKFIFLTFLLALSQVSCNPYPEISYPADQSTSEQTDEEPSEDSDNNQDFTITFPNEGNEEEPTYYPYNPYFYPPPPGQYYPYGYPYPYPPPSYYPPYPYYSQPEDYDYEDYEDYDDNYPEDYSDYDYSEPYYYYYNYYNYYPQRQFQSRPFRQRGQAMPQTFAPESRARNRAAGHQRQRAERSERASAPAHAEHVETQQRNK